MYKWTIRPENERNLILSCDCKPEGVDEINSQTFLNNEKSLKINSQLNLKTRCYLVITFTLT